MTMVQVALSDARVVELRAPTAGELRGIKLLDVLQLDPGAHAVIIDRVSTLTAAEFNVLPMPDAMALMTEVVNFFQPTDRSPPASKTPGP